MRHIECRICNKETMLLNMKFNRNGSPNMCNKCNSAIVASIRGSKSEHSEIIRRHRLKAKLKKIKAKMPKTPYELYEIKKSNKAKLAIIRGNDFKPKKSKVYIVPSMSNEEIEIERQQIIERLRVQFSEAMIECKRKKVEFNTLNRLKILSSSENIRRNSRPEVKLQIAYRNSLYRVLKGVSKGHANEMGYSTEDLLIHLGQKPSRSFNIDHKIPITWFLPCTHFSIVNSLKNLHLISRAKNLNKHNKYSDPVSKDYYNECFCFIKHEYRNMINVA